MIIYEVDDPDGSELVEYSYWPSLDAARTRAREVARCHPTDAISVCRVTLVSLPGKELALRLLGRHDYAEERVRIESWHSAPCGQCDDCRRAREYTSGAAEGSSICAHGAAPRRVTPAPSGDNEE